MKEQKHAASVDLQVHRVYQRSSTLFTEAHWMVKRPGRTWVGWMGFWAKSWYGRVAAPRWTR
jgi:hypothetical protein